MKQSIVFNYVLNCFLLFMLPLLMMAFGNQLPPALLAENFSKDIPPVIEYGETIFRSVVITLAICMPLRIASQRQKTGLVIYSVGVIPPCTFCPGFP